MMMEGKLNNTKGRKKKQEQNDGRRMKEAINRETETETRIQVHYQFLLDVK